MRADIAVDLLFIKSKASLKASNLSSTLSSALNFLKLVLADMLLLTITATAAAGARLRENASVRKSSFSCGSVSSSS